MFDTERFVQLQTLWNQVSVEFVELLIKQRREIFGKFVRLLQTTTQSVSKSRDVRHVVVLSQSVFLLESLDRTFKIAFIVQQPSEDAFLDSLVVFLFEEVIVDELHATHDKQLAALQTHVECTDWSVGRETNGS